MPKQSRADDGALAALARLRRLQSLVDAAPGAPDALLFVCGVDGRDNWGSSAAVRWLCLGESGAGLGDERPRPFDWAALPVAPEEREAAAEALEDTVRIGADANGASPRRARAASSRRGRGRISAVGSWVEEILRRR